MKKILITLLVLVLAGGLIFAAVHFLWTGDHLAYMGDRAMAKENYNQAVTFYELAFRLEPENPEHVLSMADACIEDGSYTKAERSLVNALRVAPSAELYSKLSKVYVEQNKLMDAQIMLDNITNEEVLAQMQELRPQAPVFSQESGSYDEYISLTIESGGATVYYSLDEQYPSTEEEAYSQPLLLTSGQNYIRAISVTPEGLVSSLAQAEYLIHGVVEEVHFASAELEAHIRELLYVPRTAAVMTSDLWSITELSVPETVVDFSDLNHFTGLTSLSILNSSVEDYSFLESTQQLQILDFSGSLINTDALEKIGTLKELRELKLNGCGLTNIAPLAGNTLLELLELANNSISDTAPLAELRSLRRLDLSQNALSSLDAFWGLDALEYLDISANSVVYLAPLENCSELKTLYASRNSIADISVLANMPALEHLALCNNQIPDMGPLVSCTKLITLDLAGNQLTNADAIALMPKLTHLDVSYNAIFALPVLSATAPLQQINISYNQLTDVAVLAGLPQLSYLNADYNEFLSDVLCLSTCPLLVQVDVFGTAVTEVTTLTDMGVIVNFNPANDMN